MNDEIVSLSSADDESLVGSKAASLGRMSTVAKIPKGFVVTNRAFRKFLDDNGVREKILSILSGIRIEDRDQLESASRRIEELLKEARIPHDLRSKIGDAYKDFVISSEAKKAGAKAMELIKAGREKPAVAVRASPKRDGNTSSGIYLSRLNVKGDDKLLNQIREVWISFFSPEAIYYRERRGYGHDTTFGVLVQKMIEPDKSVSYLEKNPSDSSEFIMEAVYGFGPLLSRGEVCPDMYIFDSQTSELKDRRITSKRWVINRNPSNGNLEKQPVSSSKREAQVLDQDDIRNVLSMCRRISSQLTYPSLIELCLRNRDIFLLDISRIKEGRIEETEGDGEEISRGVGVSPGRFSGRVNKNGGQGGDVLFSKKITEEKMLFNPPGAVICQYGSFSGNPSKMARELGIPMVVGVDSDGSIQEGSNVSVDGFSGRISAESESIFKEADDMETGGFSEGIFSGSITATEILASVSQDSIDLGRLQNTSGVVVDVDEEESYYGGSFIMEEGGSGMDRLFESYDRDIWLKFGTSKDSLEKAKRKLREGYRKGNENVNVLISGLADMKEFSTAMEKLERPSSARVGLVIETPIMALSKDEIAAAGVDFVLIDFDRLVDLMSGHEEMGRWIINCTPLWNLVEDICETCEREGIEICVSGKLYKKVTKKLIECGVDSILVRPDNIGSAKDMLARVEKKLLLEKVR